MLIVAYGIMMVVCDILVQKNSFHYLILLEGSWDTHNCTLSIVWIVNGKVIDEHPGTIIYEINSKKEAKRMYRAKFPRLGHFGFLLV